MGRACPVVASPYSEVWPRLGRGLRPKRIGVHVGFDFVAKRIWVFGSRRRVMRAPDMLVFPPLGKGRAIFQWPAQEVPHRTAKFARLGSGFHPKRIGVHVGLDSIAKSAVGCLAV